MQMLLELPLNLHEVSMRQLLAWMEFNKRIVYEWCR